MSTDITEYNRIAYRDIDMYKINQESIKSFRDCYLHDFDLPTIPHECVELYLPATEYTLRDVVNGLWEKGYRFFKTCAMSPKDVSSGCKPKNVDDVVNWFLQSQRTLPLWDGSSSSIHIVGKMWRNYDKEHRCFFYNDKPRLVISIGGELDKDIFSEFIENHRYDIPEQCCLEIGETIGGYYEIIELNYFGEDGICDPTPFTWEENKYDLMCGNTVFITI
jgi:hypothetical protein